MGIAAIRRLCPLQDRMPSTMNESVFAIRQGSQFSACAASYGGAGHFKFPHLICHIILTKKKRETSLKYVKFQNHIACSSLNFGTGPS